MRRTSCLAIAALVLLLCGAASAEEVDVKTLPGYVNLEDIEIPGDAGKVTEISLGPGLLKIAQTTSDNGDEQLSETLSKLQCIQVKTFEVDAESTDEIRRVMKKIAAKLKKDDWERLVTVKSEDEFVIVSVKKGEERIHGLLVMALETDGEAVFANIAGDFELEHLGDLDELLELEAADIIEEDDD
jgi:hypothetical protein